MFSFYALRCARGDVMKNAFFQKLLSYIYINYQKPKNWLLPLTGESLLVFCFLKKNDIMR